MNWSLWVQVHGMGGRKSCAELALDAKDDADDDCVNPKGVARKQREQIDSSSDMERCREYFIIWTVLN